MSLKKFTRCFVITGCQNNCQDLRLAALFRRRRPVRQPADKQCGSLVRAYKFFDEFPYGGFNYPAGGQLCVWAINQLGLGIRGVQPPQVRQEFISVPGVPW